MGLALLLLAMTCRGWSYDFSEVGAASYPPCPQDGREYFYVVSEEGSWECRYLGELGDVASLLERCLSFARAAREPEYKGYFLMPGDLEALEEAKEQVDADLKAAKTYQSKADLIKDIEAAIKKLKKGE
jgi:hypothetical protein